MTENKNVILSARDIVVEFDVRDRVLTAIRGVSLDLVEGEVLALVGESGSGKSVLTKTFTGMLEENGRVASGSIDYRGQDLTKLKSHQDWAPIRGAKIAFDICTYSCFNTIRGIFDNDTMFLRYFQLFHRM